MFFFLLSLSSRANFSRWNTKHSTRFVVLEAYFTLKHSFPKSEVEKGHGVPNIDLTSVAHYFVFSLSLSLVLSSPRVKFSRWIPTYFTNHSKRIVVPDAYSTLKHAFPRVKLKKPSGNWYWLTIRTTRPFYLPSFFPCHPYRWWHSSAIYRKLCCIRHWFCPWSVLFSLYKIYPPLFIISSRWSTSILYQMWILKVSDAYSTLKPIRLFVFAPSMTFITSRWNTNIYSILPNVKLKTLHGIRYWFRFESLDTGIILPLVIFQ